MRRIFLATLLLAPTLPADDAPKSADAATATLAELVVKLEGTEDPYPRFPLAPQKPNYYAFLRSIREAARDASIDGILLKLRSFDLGWARLFELRDALRELRRAGKKVFVYEESYGTPDLVLASVADSISIPESGTVAIPGLAIESLYMKGLLEKLHVRFDVIHIGDYKSAGENLVRDSMSQELKDSLNPILDEFYDSIVQAIADGRRIPADQVRQAIDRGILTPKEAKSMGLVDRIEYEDQFKEAVRSHFPDRKVKIVRDYPRGGEKAQLDVDNPMVALSALLRALAGGDEEARPEGPKVAVVYCTGAIMSGKSQYDWNGDIAAMGSETIAAAIAEAAKADDVKAIVLRVNSPGGSGLASDVIWREIARAKAKKPVVASMGDVAASGGYYISMNAHSVFAEPQTITGSIGVVGMVPNLEGLLTWIGITPQRLSRGKHAEGLSTTKGLSEEEREMLRGYMKSFYDDFVAKVAAGRGRTPAEIEPHARGRVWTGRKALELGLVDRLGGLEEAIAHAREKGGIAADAEFHVLEYPRRTGPLEFLSNLFEARLGIDAEVMRRSPELMSALRRVLAAKLMARDTICCAAPELSGFLSSCKKTD